MAGCSEGGTAPAVSGRARALNESNPAHSNRAPTVAATLTPSHYYLTNKTDLIFDLRALLALYPKIVCSIFFFYSVFFLLKLVIVSVFWVLRLGMFWFSVKNIKNYYVIFRIGIAFERSGANRPSHNHGGYSKEIVCLNLWFVHARRVVERW